MKNLLKLFTKWKMEWVTPTQKERNKSECNNFRPITKPLEIYVHDCFYKFLQNNGLLYLAQSGFRTLHSCETTLTKIIDKWNSNMEKGLLNGLVLLNLRRHLTLLTLMYC